MAYCPTPILVVSASTNRGELFKTYEALSAGAVDALEKPTAATATEQWEQVYRQTIKTISRIKVITHPRARLLAQQTLVRDTSPKQAGSYRFRCVAIGASTGGPAAVVRLLSGLPADFALPILLVIHIGGPFSLALSDWLNTVSPIRVRNAANGEPMPPVGGAGIIMAPPDRHLVIRGGRLWTTDDPERHHCRPSVDTMLESLAQEMGDVVIACLLTGMGRDGAGGLLAVRQAGGLTIAQDEASCVVFGMPREAIRLGAVERVLALDEIAPALQQAILPREKNSRWNRE
jgi:two-component system chemotaxis response regulator CheB